MEHFMINSRILGTSQGFLFYKNSRNFPKNSRFRQLGVGDRFFWKRPKKILPLICHAKSSTLTKCSLLLCANPDSRKVLSPDIFFFIWNLLLQVEERRLKLQQSEQKRQEVDRQLEEKERQLAQNKQRLPQTSPLRVTRVPNRLDEEEPATFGGGALNRSYSSPNIAKVGKSLTPRKRQWMGNFQEVNLYCNR